MAFLNMAREYHDAANELFAVSEQRGGIPGRRPLGDPINFLYFHTVELALKAFLRSRGLSILGTQRRSHKLTELYEECRSLGLVLAADDRFTIGNIVSLLESGNKFQGFRYYNINSSTTADLAWTREVVDALMQTISTMVRATCEDDGKAGPTADKVTLTFLKPRPKDG